CELARKWMKNPTRYEIEIFKDIKSKFSDFCPALDERKDCKDIYFTSTREGIHEKMINAISGHFFSDIFITQLDRKEKWSEPEPLDSLVNSIYDDGTPCLNKKANTLYFTRCRKEKGKNIGCQIYSAAKSGGYWGKAEKVVVLENNDNDSISVAHPSISADEKTLYFVSTMKGGYGKNDIWKVEKSGSGWGKPENLGPGVNSEYDEMYPYIREDGVLFYSSDRYPSMGGLDIFKAVQDSTGQWKSENMKYPINSIGDDFGIVFQGALEKGLFSSSRERRRDNIYKFEIPPLTFSLGGVVSDLETEGIVRGAVVKLIGSDGTMFRDTTDEEGKFKYKLKPNTDYIFVVSKEGYLNYKGTVSTDSLERSRAFDDSVFLKPTRDPIELENILYDFASAELRPESKMELNKLVEILNDNPNIIIELASHSDMVGDEQFNLELSQDRAQSVVDYLIEKGVPEVRLRPKGYGETKPKIIDKRYAAKYKFLKEGDVLDEAFINALETGELKDKVNQINRRTEFQVLTEKYIPKSK
ncbi:MAG: OmpA family protein, partial [Bacteroidetes bacterium]|nr:OmpA family protein [Bacteroidota bacterium]